VGFEVYAPWQTWRQEQGGKAGEDPQEDRYAAKSYGRGFLTAPASFTWYPFI
jgi:hypothetical protein